MVYGHRVKINGEWISAGVETSASVETISEPEKEIPKKNKYNIPYTKGQLQRMNKEKLFEVARELNCKNLDKISYQELKRQLIQALDIVE